MKKIFLTGASGMVGRNILEADWASNYDFIAPMLTERIDLFSYSSIKQILEKTKPDLVIHSAGLVGGIQANIKNPVGFLLHNLDIGRNVIIAAFETKVPNVINLGSSCMYPHDIIGPLSEDLILKGPLEPTNEGYALAKITIAKLCQYISKQYSGFRYKTIIPCNLYGRWDKFDRERSHMIPAIIAKIFDARERNLSEVEIWGDGLSRREFMYAGDLANFIGVAIEKFSELPQNINIGLGYDYTVTEYYYAISAAINWFGKFNYDITKPSGMARKLCDISLLKKFGWEAPTKLPEGIKKTLHFFEGLAK